MRFFTIPPATMRIKLNYQEIKNVYVKWFEESGYENYWGYDLFNISINDDKIIKVYGAQLGCSDFFIIN